MLWQQNFALDGMQISISTKIIIVHGSRSAIICRQPRVGLQWRLAHNSLTRPPIHPPRCIFLCFCAYLLIVSCVVVKKNYCVNTDPSHEEDLGYCDHDPDHLKLMDESRPPTFFLSFTLIIALHWKLLPLCSFTLMLYCIENFFCIKRNQSPKLITSWGGGYAPDSNLPRTSCV